MHGTAIHSTITAATVDVAGAPYGSPFGHEKIII